MNPTSLLEEDAKRFAKEKYDAETDGVPFIDKHFVMADEFAELLNKVAHAPKGAATDAVLSGKPNTRNPSIPIDGH